MIYSITTFLQTKPNININLTQTNQLWWLQKNGVSILNPNQNQPLIINGGLQKQLNKQSLTQIQLNPFEINNIIKTLHQKNWRIYKFIDTQITRSLNNVDNKTESTFENWYIQNRPCQYHLEFKNQKYKSATIILNSHGFITIEFMSLNKFKSIWNQVNRNLIHARTMFKYPAQSRFINYPIIIENQAIKIPDFQKRIVIENQNDNPYSIAKQYIKDQLSNQIIPKPSYIYQHSINKTEYAKYVIIKNKKPRTKL